MGKDQKVAADVSTEAVGQMRPGSRSDGLGECSC